MKKHLHRYGNWGVCFTYGTWFALRGLAAAGKTYHNCLAVRKAADFLLKLQLDDGGWGESYLSCSDKVSCDIFYACHHPLTNLMPINHIFKLCLSKRHKFQLAIWFSEFLFMHKTKFCCISLRVSCMLEIEDINWYMEKVIDHMKSHSGEEKGKIIFVLGDVEIYTSWRKPVKFDTDWVDSNGANSFWTGQF